MVEMGQAYFKLDGTVETKSKLEEFFLQYGFEKDESVPTKQGDYEFHRVTGFTNNKGLNFKIMWFINLAHIQFGSWEFGYFENTFTEIIGSYLPDVDHYTFDFLDNNKRTLKLSIPKESVNNGCS